MARHITACLICLLVARAGFALGVDDAVDRGARNDSLIVMGEKVDQVDRQAATPAPVAVRPEIVSSIKVGFLAQIQGQIAEEQTTASQDADRLYQKHWQRQLYVRRLRVLVGGDIAKGTSFFFESDAPNLGKVESNGTKASRVQMYVQDAQLQQVVVPEFSVIAGLQLVGITRNALQSAASLMALDFGSYTYLTGTALDNNVGRDLGINLRGFIADERLEYRLGVFSGRNMNLYSPLRTTVRFNYDFLDREKGFFYTGTTVGSGRILSVGGGIDMQGSLRALALDGFYDEPMGKSGSVTLSLAYSWLNGGGTDRDSTVFTGLIPKQRVFFLEAGYFFKEWNLQPYVRYESQKVEATVLKQVGATASTLYLQNKLRSGKRLGAGVNCFLNAHNANVKVLYEWLFRNRLALDGAGYEPAVTGQLSVQMQYFMF